MKTPISNVFLIQQEHTEVPSTTAIITLDGQRSKVSSPSRINENGNKLLTKERLFPFIIADAVTKAKLLWAMKTVVSHRYPQFVQLSRLVARALASMFLASERRLRQQKLLIGSTSGWPHSLENIFKIFWPNQARDLAKSLCHLF